MKKLTTLLVITLIFALLTACSSNENSQQENVSSSNEVIEELSSSSEVEESSSQEQTSETEQIVPTNDERASLHEYLRQNLSYDDYSWFDLVTTDVEPYIIVVEGHDEQVDNVLNSYTGKKFNITRKYTQHSRRYLEDIVAEIKSLEFVKGNKAVSSIGAYNGEIKIVLNESLPQLESYIEKFPSNAVSVVISIGENPNT